MNTSNITVAVLIHNEEKNILRLLKSLAKQTLPAKNILLINNLSTDNSLAIVQNFIQQNPTLPILWIEAQGNNLGKSRALGAEFAETKFIAYIDADCEAPQDWLEKFHHAFIHYRRDYPNIAAVGGCNYMPSSANNFYQSIAIASKSFFGNFNSTQTKIFTKDTFVPHLSTCNVCYDLQILLELGNFSEEFSRVCEDVDISTRIHKAGYLLLILAKNPVLHFTAATHYLWSKRMFRFGFGQTMIANKYNEYFHWRVLIPILFLLGFIGTIFWAAIVWPPIVSLILLYFTILISLAIYLSIRAQSLHLAASIFLLFLNTHFSYAIGEFFGVTRWIKKLKFLS